MKREAIFQAINSERERQEKLHPSKRSNKNDSEEIATLKTYIYLNEMLAILIEECGEVARAIQGEEDSDLKTELIQVASVCVRWLENINDPNL